MRLRGRDQRPVRVLLQRVGHELNAVDLLETVVVYQHLGIAGQLEHRRLRWRFAHLLPELAHAVRSNRPTIHQRADTNPILARIPAGSREGLLLEIVGEGVVPRTGQRRGAGAARDIHLDVAPSDALAADAEGERDRVLVLKQRLARRALDDLRSCVNGDHHAVGREEAVRIEGQRLGGERPAVGRKLHIEAIFAHQPGAFPDSRLRVVPPLVYQGIQDRDVRLPIA